MARLEEGNERRRSPNEKNPDAHLKGPLCCCQTPSVDHRATHTRTRTKNRQQQSPGLR